MEDSSNGGADSTSSPVIINESVHKSSVNFNPPSPSPQPPDPGDPD